MKPLNTSLLFAGVPLCLTFSSIARADTLYLSPSAIAPSIQHLWSGGGYSVQDNQLFTFPTPAIHLLNYDTVQVTVQAPVGQAWFVDTDPSFTFQSMAFRLAYNNGFSSPYAGVSSASLDFNFVQGGPGNFTSIHDGDFFPSTGDRFYMSRFLGLNGDVAFTGFTMTVQFDNASLADSFLSNFNLAQLYFQYTVPPSGVEGGAATDPGPRLALRTIPEPSAAALGLSGGLALLFARRRDREKNR